MDSNSPAIIDAYPLLCNDRFGVVYKSYFATER